MGIPAENAELLPALLSAAPIGIAIATADLHLLQVNPALCALLGSTEEALMGTPLWQHIHPDDVTACHAALARLLQAETAQSDLTLRIRTRDGPMIWTQLTGVIAPAGDHTPQRLILYLQDLSEDKSAAENRPSTYQPQQILDRITDGFLALDREWRIFYVNEAAAPILGHSLDALRMLLGTNIWEAFPLAVETPVYAAYHTAMRTGTPASVEFYYPLCRAWLSVHAYPSDDGLSILFRDITESRELAQSLRASEERHRFLLDHVPVVIYSLAPDPALTRLYFSPRHEELTGYTLAEALANTGNWLDMVHPDDFPRVAAESARADAAGDRFCAEYRLRRKDGQYVWIHDECVPARDDTGQIIAWQGAMLDITDRVTAQAAQAHLASLVMSAEDAIISSDLSGMITSWNQGATRLYGYEAEEMLGKPFEQLLAQPAAPETLTQQIGAVRTGVAVARFEAQRRRQDGSTVDVAMTMSPIRDENGVITGVSTITQDISERKRIEQALRDALAAAETASRTKSIFLAMMSHELRTPVQAVQGYAEMLLLESDGPLAPQQRADLLSIRDGARRLARLINQLLDLCRMEAGGLALNSQPVALAPIIEEVRQDVTPQALAKGLAWEIAVPAALPPAYGDPDQVRQILLNLTENAVKFTERGTVSIRTRETAGRLAVEVSDTGIGIPDAALSSIFEAFHQVDSNLSRRYGGAGLGLAIAQRLAMQMGGRISVSSSPGRGSTFVLELPLAPVDPAATASLSCSGGV